MRRSILTLATISVLALGACSSGGDTEASSSPSSSSSSSSSPSSTSTSSSPSSPEPLQAPPSDASEASADAAKEAAADDGATAGAPSADAAPEVVSEDGGVPGGGLGEEEFTTEGYLEDMWALSQEADDGSAGMTCLIFRSEPDAEFDLGEDAVLDSIDAEVVGIDREEARKFFDKKCPTADEIEAASEGDAQ